MDVLYYWGGPLWRPWNPLHFWRLVLGPSMDKIFARVVIRLAAHVVPDQSAGLWKPGVPDAGPRRTSWSGNCRERARVLQSRCGRIEFIYRIKQVCRTTTPCFWILVVSSPTCLRWKRGPVGNFFGQVPQRSGQSSIGKLTRQNLRQYTVNTNLRPNGHTRAYSPGKQNLFSNRGPLPKPTTKNQTTSNRLTQSQPFHVHLNQQTTSNRPTKKNG